jgi:hypothetical protein
MSEWRDIPSLPDYQVSDTGRVRRKERYSDYTAVGMGGRTTKVSTFHRHQQAKELSVKNYGKYSLVSIQDKNRLIHRLVAEAFIPNPENKPCVNHKDGNKQNNAVENLEWCTYSENELHSHRELGKAANPMSDITRVKALKNRKANYIEKCNALLQEKERTGKSCTELALEHGVCTATIW